MSAVRIIIVVHFRHCRFPSTAVSGLVCCTTGKEQAKTLLSKWPDIFSKGPTDLGKTDIVRHEINLTDESPFKDPYRRIPAGLYEEVRLHLILQFILPFCVSAVRIIIVVHFRHCRLPSTAVSGLFCCTTGKEQANSLLSKWPDIFSKGPTDLGKADIVRHEINLTDETPFKDPYRRIPAGLYDEVRLHLKEMLEAGAIRESQSPFSSNVVLVRKKDGLLRFCIDFRKLNSRTIRDAYTLPRIDDTIDTLLGAKFFSKLDLRSGYWLIEMKEEDKYKTAFSVGNLGFYACNRMAFGLTNAPATFQRLMKRTIGELNLRECLIFLDDILIFSENFEDHLERLEAVFSRSKQQGLKLKPSKYELFKTSVNYLGHVVSENGIKTDPDKIEALASWPESNNVKELCSFLGFTGYYRRFIKNYAKIVKPLNNLLVGHCTHKSPEQKKKKKVSVPWQLGEAQQIAFNTIKEKLSSPPILAFGDFSKPFILHTDAITEGFGAVLYKEQDGLERVITYASRGLRNSEKHYPIHKLDFLCLKWAVTDKFHNYLYGLSVHCLYRQ